jgi:uncharacterized protein (TIGR02118 family)
MIKVIAPAQRHPTNRTLAEFHNYWGESHGPLFANTKDLRRYVQHLTLPEAYEGTPKPTYDGVSMFWYDSLDVMRNPRSDPVSVALREEVGKDDRQLFDRLPGWPLHHKRASVVAEEKVIIDGPAAPLMVKAIFIASKIPGITLQEFFDHWLNVHGPLGAKLPGLRRYVQNHAVLEAYAFRGQTHDGWSELWFDDLESLQRAHASPQWQALRQDGATLFAYPMGIGIAREKIQKEIDVPVRRWGAAEMSEDDIRTRLRKEGYASLATDPGGPRRLKQADAAAALAVWTREHIVTIDASRIDARPQQ